MAKTADPIIGRLVAQCADCTFIASLTVRGDVQMVDQVLDWGDGATAHTTAGGHMMRLRFVSPYPPDDFSLGGTMQQGTIRHQSPDPAVRIPEPKNDPRWHDDPCRVGCPHRPVYTAFTVGEDDDPAWPASPVLVHYGTPVDGYSPACCPRCGIRWESGDLRPVDNQDRPTQWHCSDCGQSWTMMPRGFDTTD